MELYTSLVRLKQEMNGGVLPAMTPVPQSARHVINPEFTIGFGALTEDPEKGLRCPVQHCGGWYHNLTNHLNRSHRAVGGAAGIKRALSIPQSAKLVAAAWRSARSENALRLHAAGLWHRPPLSVLVPKDRSKLGRNARRARLTVGAKNLRNRCDAQLSHLLIDLHNKNKRSPTAAEFLAEHGPGLLTAICKAFGSFNSAKAQCGLEVYKRSSGPNSPALVAARRERVLQALTAWHAVHGSLPSSNDARSRTRLPLLPHDRSIMRSVGAQTWSEAMRRIAAILNIYGGRYGLPIEHKRTP